MPEFFLENGFLAKHQVQKKAWAGGASMQPKIPKGSLDLWLRAGRMTGCENSPEGLPAVPLSRSLSESGNGCSRARPPSRLETHGTMLRRYSEPRTLGPCRKSCKPALPAKAAKGRKSLRSWPAKKFLPTTSWNQATPAKRQRQRNTNQTLKIVRVGSHRPKAPRGTRQANC